jgi:hypothetical protein
MLIAEQFSGDSPMTISFINITKNWRPKRLNETDKNFDIGTKPIACQILFCQFVIRQMCYDD